jgi:hypothetical protein
LIKAGPLRGWPGPTGEGTRTWTVWDCTRPLRNCLHAPTAHLEVEGWNHPRLPRAVSHCHGPLACQWRPDLQVAGANGPLHPCQPQAGASGPVSRAARRACRGPEFTELQARALREVPVLSCQHADSTKSTNSHWQNLQLRQQDAALKRFSCYQIGVCAALSRTWTIPRA